MTRRAGQLRPREVSRRKFVAGGSAVLAGLAGLGLVGCGDDNKTPPKSIEQKQAEVKSLLSTREDTTAKATRGGIFASYIAADATNLDPLSSPSFTANT